MRRGVIVLNDPDRLAQAMNKMYFQLFPEEVRPATLITHDRTEIKHFARENGGKIVIKPLQGSGGQGVFLVDADNLGNLNQMIDSISRDGYVVAQEYLEAAAEGDMRLFMMNGQPLRYKNNIKRFMDVASRVPVDESVNLRARRLTDLERRLLEPTTTAEAAMQLEAIGQDGIPVLLEDQGIGTTQLNDFG